MQRTKASEQSPAQKAASTVRRRDKPIRQEQRLIPSGCTVLNCALSDCAFGGFGQGKIANIIGESSAGKTMIAETLLAEMANDPRYDDYDLYLDDSEHALEMDIAGLFGSKAEKRIKAPRYSSDGEPLYSDTVEQWYARILSLLAEGRPFVYVLDSLDTLTDASEYDQASELSKAAAKLDDNDQLTMPGSYGMAKAKLMSQILRTLKGALAKTNSTLIIISQTRDNPNARPGTPTKRRAGGKALEFYCTHTVWLTVTKTHKAGKKGAEEIIGRQVEAKVTKNKLTGKVRSVCFDIFYDYGVDDIGSCIDFLVKYGVIKQKGAYLDASCLGYTESMYRSKLIEVLEEEDNMQQLRELVHSCWQEKESALSLNRAPRFK